MEYPAPIAARNPVNGGQQWKTSVNTQIEPQVASKVELSTCYQINVTQNFMKVRNTVHGAPTGLWYLLTVLTTQLSLSPTVWLHLEEVLLDVSQHCFHARTVTIFNLRTSLKNGL